MEENIKKYDYRSQEISELVKALIKFQKQMGPVIAKSTNEFFKTGGKGSKYADLFACVKEIRTPLADNNLCYTQLFFHEGDYRFLKTIIFHESGQYLESNIRLTTPYDAKSHALGSEITYFKRYALCAVLGLVVDKDDDGNAASLKEEKKYNYDIERMALKNANGDSLSIQPQESQEPKFSSIKTAPSLSDEDLKNINKKRLIESAHELNRLCLEQNVDTANFCEVLNIDKKNADSLRDAVLNFPYTLQEYRLKETLEETGEI